jgi:putative redox protein
MPIHVATEIPGGSRQIVTVDAHTLSVDASAAAGGGTAPSPHDLFDASLASCKAITATLYARHKGLKLERVVVEIQRDDTNEKQGTYALDVRIRFEGDLTEADQQRLHEVAARCPVHKLMTSTTIEVRQSLVGPGQA